LLAAVSLPVAAEVVNRVAIEHGVLAIDHGKSIAEITQAQARGGRPAQYGLGLFVNNIEFELSIGGAPAPKGVLAMATRIRTRPTIYIARELPKGSCAFAAVLEHEQKHYAFDFDVLRAMPDEAGKIARDVFSGTATASERNMQAAKGLFFQRVKYVYEALSFAQHVGIDNPASYAQLTGVCDGEIGKRIRARPR